MIHVACSIADVIANLFKWGRVGDNEVKKRELLSAAAASGIAVAFGGTSWRVHSIFSNFQSPTKCSKKMPPI